MKYLLVLLLISPSALACRGECDDVVTLDSMQNSQSSWDRFNAEQNKRIEDADKAGEDFNKQEAERLQRDEIEKEIEELRETRRHE